jgi:hypothetical protein
MWCLWQSGEEGVAIPQDIFAQRVEAAIVGDPDSRVGGK